MTVRVRTDICSCEWCPATVKTDSIYRIYIRGVPVFSLCETCLDAVDKFREACIKNEFNPSIVGLS